MRGEGKPDTMDSALAIDAGHGDLPFLVPSPVIQAAYKRFPDSHLDSCFKWLIMQTSLSDYTGWPIGKAVCTVRVPATVKVYYYISIRIFSPRVLQQVLQVVIVPEQAS